MKKAAILLLAMLASFAIFALYCDWSMRADRREQARVLPGDELIQAPIGMVTHAITIRRSPHDVWPWLAQMGSGRAGWYSYDFIDNGGHHSAERILPEFQSIKVGTVFPALPGVRDAFVVVRCETDHDLVLSWRSANGVYLTTWAFVLEEAQSGSTRLIVRGRVGPEYHPYGLPQWVARLTAPLAHSVMQHKQLRGIVRRAEGRT